MIRENGLQASCEKEIVFLLMLLVVVVFVVVVLLREMLRTSH